jgi:hypothetical protein
MAAPQRKQPEQERPRSVLGQIADGLMKNPAELPSLGGQLDAMVREGAKDLHQTLHEVAFGKAEHGPEMGAPQNPTPQMTTADLTNGKLSLDELRGYAKGKAQEAEQHMGMEEERGRDGKERGGREV